MLVVHVEHVAMPHPETVARELLKAMATSKEKICPVCKVGHLQITGWSDGIVKKGFANGGND